jgi:hypothetical protein
MHYILTSLLAIILTSCIDITTSTTYNRSLSSSSSESNKIPLSFSESKGSVFYFILVSSNSDGTPQDLLKVRWINPDKNHRQFNGMKSALKFIIDNNKIITLTPIKEPILSGYDLNNNTREEEAIYNISREQIKEIAYAKTVEVELLGKNRVGLAKFNKWHSYRGFKDFLKNS